MAGQPAQPTGPMGIDRLRLRQMIAACPSWQSWCGAASPEIALLGVYDQVATLPPGVTAWTRKVCQNMRPLIVVWTDPVSGFRRDFPALNTRHDSGRLLITVEDNISDDLIDSPEAAGAVLINHVDALFADLCELRLDVSKGWLIFDSIEVSEGPIRAAKEQVPLMGEHNMVTLTIEYGGRG